MTVRPLVPLLILAGLLAACLAPWLVAPAAGLSGGAYDLAEWMSLYPPLRDTQPPLTASFALRALIACLALYAALRLPRSAALVLVVLLSVAQLPPLEFFTVARGNLNYGQQAALAGVSLVGGLLLVFALPRLHRARLPAAALVLVVALGCSVVGTARAVDMWTLLRLPHTLGAGVFIFAMLALAGMVEALAPRSQRRDNKRGGIAAAPSTAWDSRPVR